MCTRLKSPENTHKQLTYSVKREYNSSHCKELCVHCAFFSILCSIFVVNYSRCCYPLARLICWMSFFRAHFKYIIHNIFKMRSKIYFGHCSNLRAEWSDVFDLCVCIGIYLFCAMVLINRWINSTSTFIMSQMRNKAVYTNFDRSARVLIDSIATGWSPSFFSCINKAFIILCIHMNAQVIQWVCISKFGQL